jgi:hypothetical protein
LFGALSELGFEIRTDFRHPALPLTLTLAPTRALPTFHTSFAERFGARSESRNKGCQPGALIVQEFRRIGG